MNVTNHFALFDALLLRSTAVLASKNLRTTVRLKDFLTEDGYLQIELFNFLCWLVSDNERELYISRRCTIKFIHCQANDELLKVIKPYSFCMSLLPVYFGDRLSFTICDSVYSTHHAYTQ